MKKIIKRFWGVALAVILLSTMLVGAIPQAAAATLSWDYANLPGGTIGPLAAHNYNSIFAPTYWSGYDPACVIYDYAVAGDGTTIYAATSYGGFKSTDAGRTWSDLYTDPFWAFFGMDSTKLMATNRVAVAPDNPNLVVFLNTALNQFGLSTTGGSNLHVGPVTDAAGTNATAITDVDICPTSVIHGQTVNLVLVSGKKGSGAALYFLNYGVDFSAWDEALTSATYTTFNDHFVAGATRFVTVKHSPHFSTDYVAYLVGDNGTAPSLDIVSFNSNQFNFGVPSYQYYDEAGVPLDDLHAPAVALDRADIVFDPEFVAGNEETRFTYVSVDYASSPYQGGIYRVTDNAGPVVTANLMANAAFTVASSVWSIAINADGTTLVAASGNGSATWTITSPKGAPASIAIVPSRLVKRSGGGSGEGFSSASDNQVIAFASNGVVLSRAGTFSGAFALSRDTGYTFNDISMVNFIETNIDDQLVNAATGIERYVVASGNLSATGNATSVFYWDGTYWERTLTIKNTAPNGYLAEASPNNFNVLYLANMSTAMLRYTATAGRVNWLERSCPTPFTSGLADLEVQDDSTLWVATQVAGKGCVTKLSETGNIWPLGPPYYNVVFGSALIASITLVSPNNLVAGSVSGGVSYTNDGQTWWGIFIAAIPGGGRVHATAYSLAAGSIIYATDSTTSDIYTWTIWSSLAWYKLVDVMPTLTGTDQHAADLQINSGAMYYVSYNDTTSWIGRALDPALDDTDLSEWEFQLIQYKGTTPYTQSVTSWQPDPLKFSVDSALGTGNKIWITDAAGAFLTPTPAPDQIMVLTDTLVTYTPTVTSKDEILVQVNRETGEAYNVTVSWTAIPYKYYEFEVFYDRECTHFYGTDEFYSGANSVVDIRVGPSADADFHIYYQPGESYYYRVRVSYPYYSPWSAVHSLDVQPIRAPIPELYSPTNGGFVPDLRPGFSWSPMGFVNGGKYHIQIATDYMFTALVVDEIVDASTVDGAGYGLSKDLKDGTQYFWHVQVVEPYPGDWSTVANFRVRLAAGVTTTTFTQAGPTTVILTQTNPPATSVVVTAPVSENVVNPSYIWAIIIIGAVLVVAVIVLIFRTRRV